MPRDFQVFGHQSPIATRAGCAAAEQDRFWTSTRAVPEAAPARGHPDLTPRTLRDFAVQVGVDDLDTIDAALGSNRYASAIDANASQARELGISGTPSYVINGAPSQAHDPPPPSSS